MKKITSFILILAVIIFTSGVIFIQHVSAATLTAMSDTMSRQKASTLSSHTIKFTTPTGAGDNTDTIIIAFPSGFDFTSKNISTLTLTHGASTGAETAETLASSPSSTAWGAVFTDGSCSAGQQCTLTLTHPSNGANGDIAASDKIIVTYDSTNAINPGTTGSKTIAISGTFGDTGSFAVPIIAGTAADEAVVVTATVDPTITFTNDDAAVGFGTLTTSNARYATANQSGSGTDSVAHTLTVATNAASGYTLTYSGATLTGTPSGTITAATISDAFDNGGTAASSQFAISGVLTGSGSMASGYNHAAGSHGDGKFVASTTTTLASYGFPASDSIAMHYLANIAGTTPAGSYTTTLTFIATANF